MKKPLLITALSVVLATASLSAEVNVSPKSKKVTDLKFSGRIQGQWDGIESDPTTETEDRNHFYFRRLFLGGHAKMGDNWGGDLVLDFAASPNNEGNGKADQVFIEGASIWYKSDDGYRLDIGQKKVPFGLEEVTSSAKMKTIERSAVNRQFAETLKFNARFTGLFGSGKLADTGLSYDLAVVNSGQNHNSKDSALNKGLYGYDNNELSYYGRLSYEGDVNEISYLVGVAAGVQQNDSNVTNGYDATNAWNIFARVGTAHCPVHGIKIEAQSPERISQRITEDFSGQITILAPIVRQKKGTYEQLVKDLDKEGYSRVRINGKIQRTDEDVNLIDTKNMT